MAPLSRFHGHGEMFLMNVNGNGRIRKQRATPLTLAVCENFYDIEILPINFIAEHIRPNRNHLVVLETNSTHIHLYFPINNAPTTIHQLHFRQVEKNAKTQLLGLFSGKMV